MIILGNLSWWGYSFSGKRYLISACDIYQVSDTSSWPCQQLCFSPTCYLSTTEQHRISLMLNYQGIQNFSKLCLFLWWLFLLRSNWFSLDGCDSRCGAALSWSCYVTWKFPTSMVLDFPGQLRLILSGDLPECWRKLAVWKASTKKADLLDKITKAQDVLQEQQYPLKYCMFSSHVF